MIVVTGMHRSGTSLLCQLLHALGVSFGGSEGRFATDRWNADGYFELQSVMDANSRLITGWPRNRSRLAATASKLVYLTMPSARRIAARAPRLLATMTALAQQLRDGAVKDPRFCLTLGHWQQCATIDRVVVCLRDPAAVVDSLRRRNHLPAALGDRFYRYHVEALLAQLPLERTVFVDMDRLAVQRDAAELDLVRRFLGIDVATSSAAVLQDALRTDAYRAVAGQRRASAPPVVALWQRLLSLAEQRRHSILAVR